MFCTVCHTDPSQPAASCIKGICYPDRHLTTSAMRWGSKHEKCAKAAYVTRMMAEHVNFSVRDSGLVIHREYPEIGASPDGITWCDCHGGGSHEVKCLGRGHYQSERRSDLPWPEGSTIGQMLDSSRPGRASEGATCLGHQRGELLAKCWTVVDLGGRAKERPALARGVNYWPNVGQYWAANKYRARQ